ncbi:MAG: DUF559 domain-containing protein [Propionibacteriales bacterium]|nr:DUF559 domain-containing protein [Propionibacteriales bacterium]
MRPEEAVARLGGITTRAAILELVSARALKHAVDEGRVTRDGLGRYSSRLIGDALHAAHALSGTVSHLSAALHWGWEVKTPPTEPHVTVRRKRNIRPDRRSEVVLHWSDLQPADVRGHVTSPSRTLTDCLATLPFDEGLAVADSALRHGALTPCELQRLVAALGGRGSGTARRVAAAADARAANPFESTLRAIALGVPRLNCVPQVRIGEFRPDLVDEARRLVLEADSHTWHSSRSALRNDCRRYNALVLRGWTVLRFAWEDVMLRPDLVETDIRRFAEQALPVRGARQRP